MSSVFVVFLSYSDPDGHVDFDMQHVCVSLDNAKEIASKKEKYMLLTNELKQKYCSKLLIENNVYVGTREDFYSCCGIDYRKTPMNIFVIEEIVLE